MSDDWIYLAGAGVLAYVAYLALKPGSTPGVFVPGGGDATSGYGVTGSWDPPGSTPVTSAGPYAGSGLKPPLL